MGSLMSGWSSPVKDAKAVMHQRNRSLTRGEIDAFWKSKKAEEEDMKEISTQISQNQGNISEGYGSESSVRNSGAETDGGLKADGLF
ncbi:uncharacterized protein LOC109711110 isoform X3 [Ananas comosus]|uniref:Uncharacterized protein LOC109711110 isoform X3 n=1 Tax=Ananas comosus TaxID=4615 RepID=A0A6P5F0E2_ANACO|nr:uncharacterized protein LOC109711110 isoform X3 [Ananas comosus]